MMDKAARPIGRTEIERRPSERTGRSLLRDAASALVVVGFAGLIWGATQRNDSGDGRSPAELPPTGSSTTISLERVATASIPWCDDLPPDTPEYSHTERQAAADMVHELMVSYTDRTGEFSSVIAVAHTRSPVEITLGDIRQAPVIAKQLRLPAPLEIYCIDPNQSVSDPLGPTPIEVVEQMQNE